MYPTAEPPKIATNILNWFVPSELRDVVLGDLREEHAVRVQQDEKNANIWYWKQTINTSSHYITRYLASEDLLRKLTVLSTVILFPALIMMISWLSSVDEASDHVWQSVLSGKVHSFLFESEVLVSGSEALFYYLDFEMYLHPPAIAWAIFTFVVMYIRNRLGHFSAHQVAGWGVTMMFLPYVFGLIYIDLINPSLKMIGPTIAFMSISVLYIILPLAWFILRKSKRR